MVCSFGRSQRSRGLGLQIDDLYMIVPYWCRKAELLDDSKWLDRAIDESLHYFDYLWDEEDKLMHPLWLKKRKGPLRPVLGARQWLVYHGCYRPSHLHPSRPSQTARRCSMTIAPLLGDCPRQGENGLWHQILDQPDTYAETSCSGMFTYCILKGVNEGWLDSSFLEAGKKGWHGLLTTVNDQL